MKKGTKGFTLIELLVVIAIIGILATIVLASLNSARERARDAKRVGDLRNVQTALELFFDDNASYPTAANSGATFVTQLVTANLIPDEPLDPLNAGTSIYSYQPLNGATPPAACSATPCVSYVLRAALEDTGHSALDGDIDGTVVLDCADGTSGFFCLRP